MFKCRELDQLFFAYLTATLWFRSRKSDAHITSNAIRALIFLLFLDSMFMVIKFNKKLITCISITMQFNRWFYFSLIQCLWSSNLIKKLNDMCVYNNAIQLLILLLLDSMLTVIQFNKKKIKWHACLQQCNPTVDFAFPWFISYDRLI